MTNPTFRVLNPDGSEPDLAEIARTEEWAKGLVYCDMEGFAMFEDGALVLLDECGNWRCPPEGRFIMRWCEETSTDE